MKAKAEQIGQQVLELIDSGIVMPIVLIDGRSNSGKSTLAAELQDYLFKHGESAPRLIHMDDLYPGWNGLEAGVNYLQRYILNPLSRRERAHWQEWDWSANERKEWREFSGGTPIIIEGCGSLNKQSAPLANLRIWLEEAEAVRHARWLEREGTNDHWAEWAAQELDFYAREKSSRLADITI